MKNEESDKTFTINDIEIGLVRKTCEDTTKNGVYKIVNQINNKFYIGSSNNIFLRWKKHILALKKSYHHNTHLQRAWDKYGKDNFYFTIVEECESILIREQHFLDTLKPQYNIAKKATGSDNFTNNPNKEQIRKIFSRMYSGKGNPNYGKKCSDYTKSLIRERSVKFGKDNGRWKTIDEETQNKIRTMFRSTSYRNTVRWAKSNSIGWRVVKRILNYPQNK
jgi:group I intron endonuclease